MKKVFKMKKTTIFLFIYLFSFPNVIAVDFSEIGEAQPVIFLNSSTNKAQEINYYDNQVESQFTPNLDWLQTDTAYNFGPVYEFSSIYEVGENNENNNNGNGNGENNGNGHDDDQNNHGGHDHDGHNHHGDCDPIPIGEGNVLMLISLLIYLLYKIIKK